MNLFVRLLIRGLSLLYLAMTLIGLLGYLEMGAFPTDIFSFFTSVLGKYAIVILVFVCCFLLFAGKSPANPNTALMMRMTNWRKKRPNVRFISIKEGMSLPNPWL